MFVPAGVFCSLVVAAARYPADAASAVRLVLHCAVCMRCLWQGLSE